MVEELLCETAYDVAPTALQSANGTGCQYGSCDPQFFLTKELLEVLQTVTKRLYFSSVLVCKLVARSNFVGVHHNMQGTIRCAWPVLFEDPLQQLGESLARCCHMIHLCPRVDHLDMSNAFAVTEKELMVLQQVPVWGHNSD